MENTRLREVWCPLRLYEEAAAAGVGTPMQNDAGFSTVFLRKDAVPSGSDFVIHVNGTSMEPVYPDGCFVAVSSTREITFGQVGIFIVNGESYIKQYQPDGLVSFNHHFKTIRVPDGTGIRCCGVVMGVLPSDAMAQGPLRSKLETVFSDLPLANQ